VLPDYINAVAQYRRKRGFDFWMITPHPSLIHVNIRRLIESPSWHRHLKRTFGAEMVSELKFNYAENSCEKPGAGGGGQVTMRAFPKEVYSWYQSASLHTAKRKLPKQVFVLGGALVATVLLGFFGYKQFRSNFEVNKPEQFTVSDAATNNRQLIVTEPSRRPLTISEYFNQGMPRIPGMIHTAPRYDMLTRPVAVPRPHSCIKFGSNPCECKSQQGTKIVMSEATCMRIIKNGGVFADWDTNRNVRSSDYDYLDYYQTDDSQDPLLKRVYDIASSLREKDNREKPRTPVVDFLKYDGNKPIPDYPRLSKINGEQGRVVVSVLISEKGHVSRASVKKSSGHARLDNAALKAAKSARFKPIMINGIAKLTIADIPFDFRLSP